MVIHPNVAGKFYPNNPDILRQTVSEMLNDAIHKGKDKLAIPKAIIAPHAGYIYSGPVAASAYACLINAKKKINKVVVLALSHQYPVNGIVTTNASSYLTSLGSVPIDQETTATLSFPYVSVSNETFNFEHSLEVQLPFLQSTLDKFSLVPLLTGHVDPRQVEQVLEKLWDGPETLIIISSDLCHYLPYRSAQNQDKKTAAAILALDAEGFTAEDACGSIGIKGLLRVAANKKMQVSQIDLRNSGDTAGPKDSVVGYGAFHFK